MNIVNGAFKAVLLSGVFLLTPSFAKPVTYANNFTRADPRQNQACPADASEYTFHNQSQINNFKIKYPRCAEVPYLSVSGDDITNLDGLSNITAVSNDFTVSDTKRGLVSLSGLNKLTKVGGTLGIGGNASLTDIDGFQNLQSVGMLYLVGNPKLIRIKAMPKLSEVSGGIFITYSPSLTSIDGTFSALTSLGGKLPIIQGGGLCVSAPNLSSLKAFSSLTSVYGISLARNARLKSLDGLQHITSLINYPGGHAAQNRVILYYDKQLSDCRQLSQLYKVQPSAFIFDNGTDESDTPESCEKSIKNG